MFSDEDTLKGDLGIRDNLVPASKLGRLGARARSKGISDWIHLRFIAILQKYINKELYECIY